MSLVSHQKGTWIPKGKVITFWLWGESELEIRNILDNQNIKDVEWIKKKKPPFV